MHIPAMAKAAAPRLRPGAALLTLMGDNYAEMFDQEPQLEGKPAFKRRQIFT